ncbi:hypothetical protein Tco_0966196 [Tanacetum coccineum]
MTNIFKAPSTERRPINNKTTTKNNNFNQKVNTIKDKNVSTARLKVVLNVVKGNQGNPHQDLLASLFSEAGVLHVNWISFGHCVSRRGESGGGVVDLTGDEDPTDEDGDMNGTGSLYRRHTGSYYPKRYWELLPKEILELTTKEIWELLPKRYESYYQRDTGLSYGKLELLRQ